MSLPFQKKFMAKNPVKGFTLGQLEEASSRAQIEMAENAEILNKQNPETGGPNYEKIEEFDHAGADGHDGPLKRTDSPLNAYVSTAGHFQSMQDKFAAAFTPTKGSKTKAEKEAEFKGETEKVEEKLKETTDKEFKGFKDGEYQIPSFSGFQKNQADENYFKLTGQ